MCHSNNSKNLAFASLSALALTLIGIASAGCGARSELLGGDHGTGGTTDGAGGATGGGNQGGTVTTGCAPLGQPCALNTGCCNGLCADGICSEPPAPCANDVGPVLLVQDLSDPYSLTQKGSDLYVGQLATSADIYRVPKAAGPVEPVVKNRSYVEYLLVQGDLLYFTDEDGLFSVPAEGGNVSQIKGAFGAAGFVLTQNTIYLTEYFAQKLVEIDLTTLAAKTIVSDVPGIYRTAALGKFVYFSSFQAGLFRVDPTTGQSVTFGSDLGSSRAIVSFHDDVYFTVPNQQSVYRLGASETSPALISDLSTLGVFPEALTNDGVYLYTTLVTGNGNGLIVRMPLSGGPPEVVADGGGPSPSALVVDAACMYWTERTMGRVYRAKKP